MATATSSRRTSITVGEESNLTQRVAAEEARIERYGGNDVADPPVKSEIPVVDAGAKFHDKPAPNQNMVDWDGPDDPANPQNWSSRRKWWIVSLCILITLNCSFCSSAPSSQSTKIIAELGINAETAYSMLTVYLVGFIFGPILWGPGSELIGRGPVLIFCMFGQTLFQLPQALAKNIETLLVGRFFAGFFAVAPFSICSGIIADMFPALGRGKATSLFSASTFLGPVLGPLISGFVATSSLSWRWIFWIMMIFSGFSAIVFTAFYRETYAPMLLLKKARKLRKADPEGTKELYAEHERQDWSLKGVVHRTILRPFIMLIQEPILMLVTAYVSLVYGILYALFEALPIIFVGKHGFSISQVGLVFIGVGIGTTLGSVINHLCQWEYPVLVPKWKGFPPPEKRLYGAMIGGPLLVIGSFWLGWTGEYESVHWAAPACATIIVGMSINLVFMSFLSYLVDVYLMYAASAFSANTIVRSLVAAAFPMFTTKMYIGMGINWASTLFGLVGLLLTPCPFLFYIYGARIRASSRFAPCIDLKIAKELAEEERLENEKKSSVEKV